MKYFIRSPYHTRITKAETWWCENSCGYTTFLPDAGVYTEADKAKMEKFHESDRAEFVPITQDIWEKSVDQLNRKRIMLWEEKDNTKERYERDLCNIQSETVQIERKYQKLYNLAEELSPHFE